MKPDIREENSSATARSDNSNEQESLIDPKTSFDESKTQDDKPCDDAYGLENQHTSEIEKRARALARKRS